MKQEYFEKLKNPQWKSVHDAALADAEKAGADGFEAQIFAAVSADVHFARASEREEELEAVRLRLAAREAGHEAPVEQSTETDVGAGWTKAVASINARKGYPTELSSDTRQGHEAVPEPNAENSADGWAKATAKINAGR